MLAVVLVAALGLGSCPLWVCLSSVAVALCGGFCGACGRFVGWGGILGRGGGVAAVWAFYIVLVMGGRWWSSVVTVAAWVLLLTGCWWRIVSAAGRCLLGLCGAL